MTGNEHTIRKIRPIFVYVLLMMILVGFFLFHSEDDLRQFGNYHRGIAKGEVWRFVTSMFLHVDPEHLMLNGVSLFFFGLEVERYFGYRRFLAIYFISGLYGGLLSNLFSRFFLTVGASGAIFGLLSANLVYFYNYKDYLGESGQRNLGLAVGVLVANIIYGFAEPNIDIWGHIGGGIAGAILASHMLPEYDIVANNDSINTWVDISNKSEHNKVIIISLSMLIVSTILVTVVFQG